MTDFTHLHVHTEYSLLDGMTTPEELAEIVSTNGQVASAITDHGTMGGYLRFQKACKKQNIKSIFGVEAYFVDDVENDDKDTKAERFHLILLAKNQVGLENILKINRIAWTDQFYYKPRIDFETIENHSEGIIALSGCMGSALSQALLAGDDDRAEYLVERFRRIYRDDYYVEIQPHNPPELNKGLIDIADAYRIPLVGTLDCHFPTVDQWGAEEVLLVCGQRSSMNAAMDRHAKDHFAEACKEHNLIKKMDVLYPERRLTFKDLPLYVMDADECLDHFKRAGITRTDILENTMEIADKCNAEIKLNGMYLPSYVRENKIKMESEDYLEEIAFFMLDEKDLSSNKVYVDRLREELDVINDKKFADYFLLLWDLVSWAQSQGIGMGPGRGSACGSLLSFVLGITKVDPIKHELLFFRFLNPERNDFPDIDLDFEDKRRDEVKQYLRDRYGEDRVAGVAAYGTFQAKAVIKSICTAFCIPYEEANKITSMFETLEEFETKKELKDFRSKYPEIAGVAKTLYGRYKSASAHAAGIVVSSVPMDTIVPIEVRKEANSDRLIRVIALDKDEVGEVGLIKLDPLAVKAITVIEDCIKKVQENHNTDCRLQSENIDDPDPRVWDELNAGNVIGVFQVEGAGYADLVKRMGIYSFTDLVASNALVRPGSFDTQGATYLAVRSGKQEARYDHDILRGILDVSYGTYIYEEQVMRIAVELAGFSWGKADRLRKIISKKKDPVEFKAYESDFIDGASQHISETRAKMLWANIEKASTYMFNKSHSTAYSLISYQTMWLKINYPLEFMWATLYNEDKPESLTTFLYEAERLGLEILGPDVEKSMEAFSIEDGKLRFGILNVVGCGSSVATEILKKRPFDNFEEFVQRTATNKVRSNNIEALEKVGFFESIGHAPYEKERYYGSLLNYPKVFESVYDDVFEPISKALDEPKDVHIIRGIVKNTKKTAKYFRIEIEDATGVYSGFADKNMEVKKRDYVIAMVGDNCVMHVEDFNQVAESKSKFAGFLNDQINGNDDPYSEIMKSRGLELGINIDKYSLGYLLSMSTFMTRSGQMMANLYLFIPEYGILKQSLFGNQIEKFVGEIHNQFDWKMIKLANAKRGGYYLNDIQNVQTFCRMRGIMLDT